MDLIDRHDAGRRLAGLLGHLAGEDVIVLALPRGGVPVGAEIAAALRAPLDVVLVRKLGVPFQPELAMGAIGEGGVRVRNEEVLGALGITEGELARVEAEEHAELDRRARLYRGDRPPPDLSGRTVVVVDDGLATGSTARVACLAARAGGAGRVVLAVPVAPPGWTTRLADVADESVCLETPEGFMAIGQFYRDFRQTSDAEVVEALGGGTAGDDDPEVSIPVGPVQLAGRLSVPRGAGGIVVFAHGSGSSRHSPRNQFVAERLNRAGLATLLFDLLTEEEELDRSNVFDTELLAGRLSAATAWLGEQPGVGELPVGCFGASTGAAAALWSAAEPASPIATVVSRGGRPDLAGPRLPDVTVPVLLIVGGEDPGVLELNRRAAAVLGGEQELAVVPGATHLFAEPGALEQVAELAVRWFGERLVSPPPE